MRREQGGRRGQLVYLDETYKILPIEEQIGKEIEEVMRSHLWNKLEVVHSADQRDGSRD